MHRSLSTWQRNTLRLLAWVCLAVVFCTSHPDLANAQEHVAIVDVEESGFLGDLLHSIFTFNSDKLLKTLGDPRFAIPAFIALNVIVFVETGLLIGFFLPGDSLLVITGLICARPDCGWSLPLLLVTLSISAIAGDTVGYWIGVHSGPKIFNREQSFFFHKDHLLKAQAFYVRHGGKTIILARFMPILRTFAPVVAGVGKMEYRQFLFFNVIGGVSWIVSMVLAGFFLPAVLNPLLRPVFGTGFQVEKHVEKVVIIVVFLSILPGILAWIKSKFAGKPAEEPQKPDTGKAKETTLAA